MLESLWDSCQAQVVRLVSAAALPPTSDNAEHPVIHIDVAMPPADNPDDDRFSLSFQTATGKTLRVRLPADQLRELARVLLELAQEPRMQEETQ
jgi:hypothetical protein